MEMVPTIEGETPPSRAQRGEAQRAARPEGAQIFKREKIFK